MNKLLRPMTAIYLLKGNKVLLLYRQGGRVVNNVYTGSAGGHLEKDELSDPRACVLREMREELSLTEDQIENLRLRYVALRYAQDKGEIRQNFYFFANLAEGVSEEICSNEGVLRWVDWEEALGLEMPFCAKFALEHYWKIGRHNDHLYGGVATQENLEFVPMDMDMDMEGEGKG